MLRPSSFRKAQVAASTPTVLCDVHKEEEVRLYCNNCNCLICNECVVDQHVGHEFKRIKDIAEEKRRKVTETLDHIEKKIIPEVREKLEKTGQIKTEHSKNGTTVIYDISERANFLITEIENVRDENIQEVNTFQSVEEEKLCEYEQKLREILSNAEEAIALFRNELKSSKDDRIVKMDLDLDAEVKEFLEEIDVPDIEYTAFEAGKERKESIKGLFGRCLDKKQCEAETESDILPQKIIGQMKETKLEVDSSFYHERDKGEIRVITTLDEQYAWVASYQGKEIKRVNKAGKVDDTLTFTTQINDIAITNDGCLLVVPHKASGRHQYQIKKVKPNGDIETFVDMKPLMPRCNKKPLMPRCICVSMTGDLYVGCVDGEKYDVTDNNTRSVMKLSDTGFVQQSYQYDNNEHRLFTFPSKIQENINGDVWVYDRTSRRRGRMVVIQQDGQVKFIYTGVRNDRITGKFNPNDLTAVGNGNMLCNDINNNIIHVIDENGTLLYFLGSQHETGIYGPTAICLNRKNNILWLGNIKGEIQILRLK